MTSFDEDSQMFLTWLRQNGAEISSKIQLQDLRARHAGRGVGTLIISLCWWILGASFHAPRSSISFPPCIQEANGSEVATQDISEGEVLFKIPRSLVLSVENSSLSSKIDMASLDLDPWSSLVLVMLYESVQPHSRESPWLPYFKVLPDEFDTLMYWTPDELEELQASAVRNKIGKESADKLFTEKVLPVVREHSDLFCGGDGQGASGEGIGTLGAAHKMASTIMAYAFDIEPTNAQKDLDEDGYATEDEDEALPKGMVPLADMLNAAADMNNVRALRLPIHHLRRR